jgi:hypothetical protein
MKMVYVVGGNMNSRLNKWLRDLCIYDFIHVALDTASIDPLELKQSAVSVRQYVGNASALISVGLVADKVLNYAIIEHGTLPATSETDPQKIKLSIDQCRQYLLRRIDASKYTIHSRPPSSS